MCTKSVYIILYYILKVAIVTYATLVVNWLQYAVHFGLD